MRVSPQSSLSVFFTQLCHFSFEICCVLLAFLAAIEWTPVQYLREKICSQFNSLTTGPVFGIHYTNQLPIETTPIFWRRLRVMNHTSQTYDLSWVAKKATRHCIAHDVDFFRLYHFIKEQHDYSYLFESLALPRHQDRFHTCGFDPALLFEGSANTLKVTGHPQYLSLFGATPNAHRIVCDNPYKLLQSLFPYREEEDIHHGGLIGFAAHECVNYFEESIHLAEHADFPPFQFGLFLDGLVYDTTTGSLFYYTYDKDRSAQITQYVEHYKSTQIPDKIGSSHFIGHSATQDEFLAAVETTRDKIRNGYSFQAEVGFKSHYAIAGDKIAIYNKLRDINPGPYMYHMAFGHRVLLGASPEILISMRNRKILTTPTAGTIVRGQNQREDIQLARQLLNDPKEIAEHNMLVDLHRNDIARVCEPGSVFVDDLMYIIKFSHVQHIVSNVVGKVAAPFNSFDVLSIILPGGVVTGAPKIETIKIIEQNEKQPRGPYGGAVGRFSFNGDCDFCLPIRSIFCIGDQCFAQTSAGVVYDSKPEKEYKEVLAKLAAMTQTLQELGVKNG